jgi:hypothetical protein
MERRVSRGLGLCAALLVLLAVAAPAGAPVATATDVLRVSPQQVQFGTKQVGTFTVRGAMVTNIGANPVVLSTNGGAPDDFSWGLLEGQTCPVLAPAPLGPGESCQAVMGFRPSEYFAGREQAATLELTAVDPPTGAVLGTAVIVFTGRGR